MKLPTASLLLLLAFLVGCAERDESADPPPTSLPERTLVGQVLLPDGDGPRGVELQVLVTTPGGEPRKTWVRFDEEGHLSHMFQGDLMAVTVTAGLGATVHRIDAHRLPPPNSTGRINLGTMDLRKTLLPHRLQLQAADGAPQGDVRLAVCLGLPPVGPAGGRVSLGSNQFPEIPLGTAREWLLPDKALDIYFLVERPADDHRGRKWRTGDQHLFGPFNRRDLPDTLVIE